MNILTAAVIGAVIVFIIIPAFRLAYYLNLAKKYGNEIEAAAAIIVTQYLTLDLTEEDVRDAMRSELHRIFGGDKYRKYQDSVIEILVLRLPLADQTFDHAMTFFGLPKD
jgi:hypothetical protein